MAQRWRTWRGSGAGAKRSRLWVRLRKRPRSDRRHWLGLDPYTGLPCASFPDSLLPSGRQHGVVLTARQGWAGARNALNQHPSNRDNRDKCATGLCTQSGTWRLRAKTRMRWASRSRPKRIERRCRPAEGRRRRRQSGRSALRARRRRGCPRRASRRSELCCGECGAASLRTTGHVRVRGAAVVGAVMARRRKGGQRSTCSGYARHSSSSRARLSAYTESSRWRLRDAATASVHLASHSHGFACAHGASGNGTSQPSCVSASARGLDSALR
jgi:hypothetical protein